ncbi:unnamed protein product [Larinioides sclopetarius]|uniref:Serpin domain-containing protein n=1 Tax=Larinioides sclopetarius TaxID=280406 RepID=A0AAV2BQ10_9ARAC
MHMTSRFPYASFDNYEALELPYNGGNVSMVILLPNERDGLQDLEESLTPERLDEIQRRFLRTDVDISLPKFKLQFEKELSPEIRALGANRIFRNGADFSGMTSSRNVAVSQVVHKAVIEVNEKEVKLLQQQELMWLLRAQFVEPHNSRRTILSFSPL